MGFESWIRKIPWRRAWQPTPVFLPGESYGQRSLVGYSLWGCKKSDMAEMTEYACTLMVFSWSVESEVQETKSNHGSTFKTSVFFSANKQKLKQVACNKPR